MYGNILYMKLAFVGPPAVGKDAVSNYIELKYRLTHISSGDIIREYVKENKLGGIDRENLQKVANELRRKNGGDVLVKIALEKTTDDLILSGLRAIDEVITFKKLGGIVITITAHLDKRYSLTKLRGRIGDDVSLEDFIKIEDKEMSNADRNSQNVKAVVDMADIVIINDGTLDELYKKCDEVMDDLLKNLK